MNPDTQAAGDYWRQFHATIDWATPQTVAGRLEHLGEFRTRDELIPRLRIRLPDGSAVVVVAAPKRLLAELIRVGPAVGDLITIRYDGDDDRAAPGMRPAKRFTVEVTRDAVTNGDTPDWWTANGWADQAEHDTYRAHVTDLLAAAGPDQQAKFKAWRQQQKIPAFTRPHTRDHADLVASHIIDILNTPSDVPEPDSDSGDEVPVQPDGGGKKSIIEELYARVHARVEALTDDSHATLGAYCTEVGIDPTKKVGELTQDQVHVIDAFLDTLATTP